MKPTLYIHRWSFIQLDGDVHETVLAELRNETAQPFETGAWLFFPFTDAATTLLRGWDTGGESTFEVTKPDGRCEVAIQPKGPIAAGSNRFIAFEMLRQQMVSITEGELFFRDPETSLSFDALAVVASQWTSTVVFPRDPYRREILAPGSCWRSSRSARWSHSLADGQRFVPEARHRSAALRSAPCEIDDALAGIELALTRSLLNERPDFDPILRSLNTAGAEARELVPLIHTLTAREFDAAAIYAEMTHIRTRLEGVREDVVARNPPPPEDATVVDIARCISAELESKGLSSAQVGSEFADSLYDLVRFVISRRVSRSSRLPATAIEQDLQNQIEEFLRGASDDVISQVEIGNGRVDLLLRKTAIELKAEDLGANPHEAMAAHAQQAAEYASRKQSRVALLVTFDRNRERAKNLVAPLVRDQFKVAEVPPAPGLGGASKIFVVAFVVPADQIQPSELPVLRKRNSTR